MGESKEQMAEIVHLTDQNFETEVIERGRCSRDGFATIGFGAATGRILPALAG